MNRSSLALVSVCLVLGSGVARASTISIDSGLLSVAGGGLVSGPGGWWSASVSYDVSSDDTSHSYFYNYTFTGADPVKNISHVITQVSDNFTAADILNA